MGSFGYSGTIVHAVLSRATPELKSFCRALSSRRYVFAWSHPAHVLLQVSHFASFASKLPLSNCRQTLSSGRGSHRGWPRHLPCRWLPRSRTRTCCSPSHAANLNRIVFLQPLSVESAGFHLECTLDHANFQISSGFESAPETVHCSGTVVASSGKPQQMNGDLQRSSCALHAVDVAASYRTFHAAGLQYGPHFRAMAEAWIANEHTSVACLRARPRRDDVALHPADLDGALQLSAVSKLVTGSSEPRLPFSVDSALLSQAQGMLWASAALNRANETASIALGTSGRASKVLLAGVHSRVLRAQLTGNSDLYSTEWLSRKPQTLNLAALVIAESIATPNARRPLPWPAQPGPPSW